MLMTLLITLFTALIGGCSASDKTAVAAPTTVYRETKSTYEVVKLFDVEGCNAYAFKPDSITSTAYRYFIICPNSQTVIDEEKHTIGKVTHSEDVSITTGVK